MKGLLIAILAIASASCNKGDCRKCYTVTYENGVEVSRDFDKKKCIVEGKEFWNTTFEPNLTTGTQYVCPE